MDLRIYGYIKDAKTSLEIIDANVKLFRDKKELMEVKSSKNGFFEIVTEIDDSRVESDQQFRVTVEKDGYQKQEHHVLGTKGSFNLDVNLHPEVVPPPSTPKEPFSSLPLIIGGVVVLALLIGAIIAWFLLRPKDPEIIKFSLDSSSIDIGESATLSWDTKNALFLKIEPGIGEVEPQGDLKVKPAQTTEYKLIAINKKKKSVSKALTLDVVDKKDANELLDTSGTIQTKSGGLNIMGSVGIGTKTPSTELEVNGTVAAKSFSGPVDWSDIANVPSGFADKVDNVDDADADPDNEIQTISTEGNKITLSKGGSVVVPYAANAGKLGGKDSSDLLKELIGSGSSNFIGKWSGSGSLGNSAIYDDNGKIGIGTREPEVELHVKGEVKSVVEGINFYMVPAGAILPWYPGTKSVPKGWAICNGSNGTPDLRDRFILGTSEGENPGGTGGVSSYRLTIDQLPPHAHTGSTNSGGTHSHSGSTKGEGNHSHEIPMGNKDDLNCTHSRGQNPLADGRGIYWTGAYTSKTGSHSHSFSTNSTGSHSHTFTTNAIGSGAPIDNRPKFYKLVFIMKLD